MKLYFVLIFQLWCHAAVYAQQSVAGEAKPLAVIPTQVAGVQRPLISLNGTWEIKTDPGYEIWKSDTGHWNKIKVPGEPAMQGHRIESDKEFFYRTTIVIPADAKDRAVLLRFNGVYSYARVFVNGKFVREHSGGFTSWDVDITPYVKPGAKAVVYVGVTDRVDDISYASGYAHHLIGGILRDVQLLVLPQDYIHRLYVNTTVSNDNKKASLSLEIGSGKTAEAGRIRFQFFDPTGKPVLESARELVLDRNGDGKYILEIQNPKLWNEEQPNLYTLKVQLIRGAGVQQTIDQKIGIRSVTVDGKRLLVNGVPVKLRGACRHDMHPLLGRSTNRYYDSLDVVLAKEANINFIRTSHYPPSRDFLEFADKFGLYVQEETAVCFVSNGRVGIYKQYGPTYNDSSYTERYLNQLSEMIDRDRNHASVIMWSIGNENTYGFNFQKEYEFVKAVDLSRPVAWSFPGTAIRQGKQCFDIAVAHYPRYDGTDTSNAGLKYKNMEHDSLPLLGDEWAHVACYNTTLLKMDPNIKDFWGRSLDTMWASRFDVPGNLGGAIWGMIDEIFHLPDSLAGYGPWGIVDVWRRKKPEFWNTKKAYSPVRISQKEFDYTGKAQLLAIPVKNRFNHLSLGEARLKVTTNNRCFFINLPDVKPHETGMIPLQINGADTKLLLQFYDTGNRLLDEERITLAVPVKPFTKTKIRPKWIISRRDNIIYLTHNDQLIQLSTQTGELIKSQTKGKTVLTGALKPVINWPTDPKSFYETSIVSAGAYLVSDMSLDTTEKSIVIVRTKGFAGKIPVELTSSYHADGTITIHYKADNIPDSTWQIGIALPVTNEAKRIRWKRKGYWSTYPADHISSLEGTALRNTHIKEQYRTRPSYQISHAVYDYFLMKTKLPEKANLKASEAYRGTKENIVSFELMGSAGTITLCSNGHQAAKMNVLLSGKQELLVLDKWDYWGLAWGNFSGTKNRTHITGSIVLRLTP